MNNKEIDRLIAEKVMGWETQVFANINVIEVYADDTALIVGEDWSPTTRIDHAWQVAEKLFISVCPQCGAPKDMSVHAKINNRPKGSCYEVFAETAPLAICKVALKSLGVSLNDIS